MQQRTFTGFVALAALLLFAVPAAGQGLDIGAEAGVNISDLSIEDEGEFETESTTGLRVGGVLRVGLSEVFGLQSGLYYSQKGAEAVETGLDSTLELDLDYFEVPLFLTVAIPTGPSPITPRLYAGGQLGFESTCELTSSIQGSSATVSCDEEGLNTESTDVSVVFGGGLDFAAGPGKFTVDARYDHGLTDIFAEDEGDADDLDETNKNIALSAGYLISLP